MYKLPFNRDHPHIRSPKGVMSCEEIRYWIRRLLEEWPARCLARTLGFKQHGHLTSKLKRSWIYPGEQGRLSKILDRIISGELVPQKHGQRWDAVVAQHPVPLHQPGRLRFDLTTGRVGWLPRREVRSEPRLPAFGNVIDKAGVFIGRVT